MPPGRVRVDNFQYLCCLRLVDYATAVFEAIGRRVHRGFGYTALWSRWSGAHRWASPTSLAGVTRDQVGEAQWLIHTTAAAPLAGGTEASEKAVEGACQHSTEHKVP